MGRPVQDVLPNTRLNVVIERQREEYNKIQDVGNVKILTNRCPIFSQGRADRGSGHLPEYRGGVGGEGEDPAEAVHQRFCGGHPV